MHALVHTQVGPGYRITDYMPAQSQTRGKDNDQNGARPRATLRRKANALQSKSNSQHLSSGRVLGSREGQARFLSAFAPAF